MCGALLYNCVRVCALFRRMRVFVGCIVFVLCLRVIFDAAVCVSKVRGVLCIRGSSFIACCWLVVLGGFC